ncbi:MAG: hypothetical protein LUH05_01425 [Candidatus Gastranaerophilales bacterium]|nr:hypothetical protein [Candidatus Gastranaerophilales bacterium]
MTTVTAKKVILKDNSGNYLIPYTEETDLSDYVKKDEIDELSDTFLPLSGGTMQGVLKSDIQSSGINAIQFTNGNFAATDTSAPDSTAYNGRLNFYGADSNQTGACENFHNSGNLIATGLRVYRSIDDTSYNSYIQAVVDSSGNAYAQCPTYTDYTDSSTKIATTAFVKNVLSASGKGFATYSKAANGYIKFVNGIIFQWGTTTLSINSTTTVTFPTAFTSTNYVINANFFASANIDDNPIPYASSTSSFCIYGTNKGANDSWSSVKVAWTAVGY